ncbi:scoloptoxin SSD976-like, partial [Amblyomma americanum]
NNYRSRVAQGQTADFPQASNMLRLEWDDELMISAYAHAHISSFKPVHPLHDRVQDRFTSRFPVTGQSVCRQPPAKPVEHLFWEKAIKTWFDEVIAFPPDLIKSYSKEQGETENFTQMIWASTRFVGCHVECAPDMDQRYVCNYAPQGNVQGQPVYAVGPPCSRCPSGTACVEGLCTISQEPSPWPPVPDYTEYDGPHGSALPVAAAVGIFLNCLLQLLCCN